MRAFYAALIAILMGAAPASAFFAVTDMLTAMGSAGTTQVVNNPNCAEATFGEPAEEGCKE